VDKANFSQVYFLEIFLASSVRLKTSWEHMKIDKTNTR
jgi:hypothetical protein